MSQDILVSICVHCIAEENSFCVLVLMTAHGIRVSIYSEKHFLYLLL